MANCSRSGLYVIELNTTDCTTSQIRHFRSSNNVLDDDNDDLEEHGGHSYGNGKSIFRFSDYLSKLVNNTILAGVTCEMSSLALSQIHEKTFSTIGINASYKGSAEKLVFITTIGHKQSTVFNVSYETGRNLHRYYSVTSVSIEPGEYSYLLYTMNFLYWLAFRAQRRWHTNYLCDAIRLKLL